MGIKNKPIADPDELKIVEVTWIDSQAIHGWVAGIELEKFIESDREMICRSVGYLFDENSSRIVIVQSLNGNNVDGATKIPKVAIQKIRELK